MKALVYDGPGKIEYRDHPMPTLTENTDLLMRVTHTTICGTDSHIIKGGVPTVKPGTVLGHEATGVVEEVGSSVTNVRPGDRILAVCVSACGYCRFCTTGMYGQCVNGGWALGHTIDGVQAEYARIPFARNSVYKIPEALTDEQVLFLTDILATGYEVGVLNGQVRPGDTVVIVGAGPVGLSATVTARLFSPRNIVVVERTPARREMALKLGATHAVGEDEVRDLVGKLTDGYGADVTIEAVGFPDAFELAAGLVRSGGRIANIGVHEGPATLHLEQLWSKQVTITTGIPSGLTIPQLMNSIATGALDATRLISHRLPLAETMRGYDVFTRSAETGALKVVLTNN
ncbi:alcohol dehydrogenase catalytic domain-containing protein [Streptomyces sp. NPDC058457]|uniref:alcohol dehydrogenase catalytic domain-containing protein n=1 Tax=Streptomyces sp. NPDC058457 TaxID=3346507 RepID=UPI00365F0369